MDNQYTVGGRTYSYTTLPAEKAVLLEIEVAKLIGEPLFRAFSTEDKQKSDTELMGVAIGMLFSKAEGEKLLWMLKLMFEHVSCDGKRIEINSTFTGRNREMLQVFGFGLRYNFRDFFPESLLASLRAKMAEALG